MPGDTPNKVLVRRPTKIRTDSRGRSVWADPVESAKLDPATGFFEIIDDADLQAILDINSDLPKLSRPVDVTLEPLHDYADDESLSLVTTMALRKVLTKGDEDSSPEPEFDSSGMDPYNSN